MPDSQQLIEDHEDLLCDRYVTESAFLAFIRSSHTQAPNFRLEDVAQWDTRLGAHLEGVRHSGIRGWKACHKALEDWGEAGEVFLATVISGEDPSNRRFDEVVEYARRSPTHTRAMISGIGWLPWRFAESVCSDWLSSSDPVRRYVALASFALHRRDPGAALKQALGADDHALRARAIKAVGELGRVDLLKDVRIELSSSDATVRYRAAWTCTLFSQSDGLRVLLEVAERNSQPSPIACQLAAIQLPVAQCREWLSHLLSALDLTRLGIIGAGASGLPEFCDWLLAMMEHDQYARIAADAFQWITGLDLESAGFARPMPIDFTTGPTEDPADQNVVPDPDERRRWPDPATVRSWWAENQNRFQPETRYLLGRPLTLPWLANVLEQGTQPLRHFAATEICRRRPGTPLFEVRAPAQRQYEFLKKLSL